LAFLIAGILNSASGLNTAIDCIKYFFSKNKIHRQTRKIVTIDGMKFLPVDRGSGIYSNCFYDAVGISREDIYNRVVDILDGKETLPPYEYARFINCICQICDISKLATEEDLEDFDQTLVHNTKELNPKLGHTADDLLFEKINTSIPSHFLPIVKRKLRDEIIGHPIGINR